MEKLHKFPDRNALVTALAGEVTALLARGIEKNGRASLAVSGGSTPVEAAQFIGMKTRAATVGEGEAECEERLKDVPLPFDVLILGMGGDGHTASLFPGAKKLPAAIDMNSGRQCMALAPLAAPHERMSLTLPVILSAKNLFLHIVGPEKMQVLEKALADGPLEEMPIRFVLRNEERPVNVYWAP